MEKGYKDFITEVPNFPKDGIDFKDISPLLADQETFRSAIVDMGAIKIRPIRLTYPTEPGGRLSTLHPVIMKNNVPGIAK